MTFLRSLKADAYRGCPLLSFLDPKYRFIFLKKASRRTNEEQRHIDEIVKDNDQFLKLELIKERMIAFFDQPDEYHGRMAFHDVGAWILQGGFTELKKCYWNLDRQWNQLANYFKHRGILAGCVF